MHLLYNISIWLYSLVIYLASIGGNKKAKLWVKGRQRQTFPREKGIVWVHCASLGEFEQGRSLIEALKNKGEKVLLTFFSPSGYEAKKNDTIANWVHYLPLDSPRAARNFLNTVQPKMAIFVKYEFWPNYLLELQKDKTPTYVVSAIFRKKQHFFKWYGFWFRKILSSITHFFVQDEVSKELLHNIKIKRVTVSGDSRFDRVVKNAKSPKDVPLIKTFKGSKKLIVCGSSWPQDEALLIEVMKERADLQFLFAPHEIQNCSSLQAKSGGLLYSQATEKNCQEHQVLIIDSIGLLVQIYQYADLAYIGGGFGAGIHNTLEAAAFGCPLIFGPNYHKFKEAHDLINQGYATSINNQKELLEVIDSSPLLQQPDIQAYCTKNIGATTSILKGIY